MSNFMSAPLNGLSIAADNAGVVLENEDNLRLTSGSTSVTTVLNTVLTEATVHINVLDTVNPSGPVGAIQFNDGSGYGGNASLLINQDTSQIRLNAGTAAAPIVAFSDAVHPAGNYDTGVTRRTVDQVAFIAEQNPRVTVSGSAAVDNIPGLNVGESGGSFNGAVGIRRQALVPANSFEDGSFGNTTFLLFTAADFKSTRAGRSVAVNKCGAVATLGTVISTTTFTSPIGMIASKVIPKGYRLREANVLIRSLTNPSVTGRLGVLSCDIENPAAAGVVHVVNNSYQTNTADTSFSGTITGTGSTIITLVFIPATGQGMSIPDHGIAGASILMQRI
jgi:hypothetical protein